MPSASRSTSRARQQQKPPRGDSSDEDDYSTSTSGSEDEEKAVGRREAKRNTTKPTMYRSLPSGAAQGQTRRSAQAAPPSDSEEEYSSDDAAGTQEKAAPRGAPTPQATPQRLEQKSSNLKWYLLGGLVVLLCIAAGGGFWWYNRDSSSTSDSDSSALTSTSTSNSSSLPIVKPGSSTSPISGASSGLSSATSGGSNSTSASMTETSKGSLTSTHDSSHASEASDPGTIVAGAATPTSVTWVPSLTANEPEQTKPAGASNPAATQTVRATYFVSDNGVTPCLSRPNDGDFVVHVSPKFYGSLPSVSKRCGRWVSMWNEQTNYTVTGSIEGVCADCNDYELDLSQAAFYGLTWDMEIGEIQIQWWWTEEDRMPTPSIKTIEPPATRTDEQRLSTPIIEPVSFSALQPKWQKGTALWFHETGGQGACKSWNGDQDFVFGLPQVIYGDPASASSLCCAEVLVKEPNSGKTVKARVADASGNEYFTLSLAAFATLSSPDIGMVEVQYYFTDSSVIVPNNRDGDSAPKDSKPTPTPAPAPSPQMTHTDDQAASKAPVDAVRASSSSAAAARASKEAKPAADAAWASSSRAAAAVATKSASGGGQTFTGGFATFYLQKGNPGHCGTVAQESDKVIALPSAMYADGAHCGKQIRLTRTDTGKSVTGTVRDSCPTCVNDQSLDLSVGAFNAIADQSEGVVPFSWMWA